MFLILIWECWLYVNIVTGGAPELAQKFNLEAFCAAEGPGILPSRRKKQEKGGFRLHVPALWSFQGGSFLAVTLMWQMRLWLQPILWLGDPKEGPPLLLIKEAKQDPEGFLLANQRVISRASALCPILC